jgi:hypothetical protein
MQCPRQRADVELGMPPRPGIAADVADELDPVGSKQGYEALRRMRRVAKREQPGALLHCVIVPPGHP